MYFQYGWTNRITEKMTNRIGISLLQHGIYLVIVDTDKRKIIKKIKL